MEHHSHDPDHHVSIQEPSPEELKEIEKSQDNFEDSHTGIICSVCQKNESHYECYPCRCCTFCKKCAMKVATGKVPNILLKFMIYVVYYLRWKVQEVSQHVHFYYSINQHQCRS